MKMWMKAILFLLVALIVSAIDSQAQTQKVTSIFPSHVYSNTPVTVTITGKNFKTGMVLLIASQPQKTKVVNQYKMIATIDTPFTTFAPGKYRYYILDKYGRIDLGEQYLWLCAPFFIDPNPPDGVAGLPYSHQMVIGGCPAEAWQ